MRILFIGDVVGKPGRRAVASLLPALRNELRYDVAIANGENSAGGAGITAATAADLFAAGVDLITTGNHVWDQREALAYLPTTDRVLRPLNFPPGAPGAGAALLPVAGTSILVVNAIGRVYMTALDDPFRGIDDVLARYSGACNIVVVDFHAEATGEKRAMGYHLDGRTSLVVGTHTHVPTADAQLLPNRTAYITDVGMVGPINSVIGVAVEPIVRRFVSGLPQRFDTSADPNIQFNAVLAVVDDDTGKALSIERVDRTVRLDSTHSR